MRGRGDLRPEADPDALAFALLAAMQGGMLLTQMLRQTQPLKAAFDAVLAHVQSLAAALRARPGCG
jgi:TetR/AcrR family transcriptional regulator, transcriptional repressor for nem operon